MGEAIGWAIDPPLADNRATVQRLPTVLQRCSVAGGGRGSPVATDQLGVLCVAVVAPLGVD